MTPSTAPAPRAYPPSVLHALAAEADRRARWARRNAADARTPGTQAPLRSHAEQASARAAALRAEAERADLAMAVGS